MNRPRDGDDMGKEDRKRRVLKLLADSGLALPPAVIFRNVKLRGATFERRIINDYLKELAEDGLIEKVDPEALEEGEIESIDLSEEGYFVITEAGLDVFE